MNKKEMNELSELMINTLDTYCRAGIPCENVEKSVKNWAELKVLLIIPSD